MHLHKTQLVLYEVMDPRTQLYTRQQIASLTRLDDSTLNYWMREEVLRPTSGGGGKGQRRRFAFPEVNLAALFGELKKFGVSIGELRKLSVRFHEALDFMDAVGITRRNYDAFESLLGARRELESEGHVKGWVYRDKLDAYQANAPWMLELERVEDRSMRGYFEVHLTWEQNLAFLEVAHLIFGRAESDAHPDQTSLAETALQLNTEEFARHRQYWSLATILNRKASNDDFSTSLDYFCKDEDGNWLTVADSSLARLTQTSFVAIDLERLSFLMWGEE